MNLKLILYMCKSKEHILVKEQNKVKLLIGNRAAPY